MPTATHVPHGFRAKCTLRVAQAVALDAQLCPGFTAIITEEFIDLLPCA